MRLIDFLDLMRTPFYVEIRLNNNFLFCTNSDNQVFKEFSRFIIYDFFLDSANKLVINCVE